MSPSYQFRPRPWEYIADDFDEMAAQNPDFRHMAEIVHSVMDEEASDLLAAHTSMCDLMVVSRPIMDPPYDRVAVRAPNSMRRPGEGQVTIEHLSITGRDDCVSRPVADAVPLFWRFMTAKFGVHSTRSVSTPQALQSGFER